GHDTPLAVVVPSRADRGLVVGVRDTPDQDRASGLRRKHSGQWAGGSRLRPRSPEFRWARTNRCRRFRSNPLGTAQARLVRLRNRRKAKKLVMPMPRRATELGSGTAVCWKPKPAPVTTFVGSPTTVAKSVPVLVTVRVIEPPTIELKSKPGSAFKGTAVI